jgi:hypothetical protein
MSQKSMLIIGTADMYMNATTDAANAALRARPGPSLPAPQLISAPAAAPATGSVDATAPAAQVVQPTATPDDPDASPASAPPKSKTPPPPKDEPKADTASTGEGPTLDEDSRTPLPNGGVAGGDTATKP